MILVVKYFIASVSFYIGWEPSEDVGRLGPVSPTSGSTEIRIKFQSLNLNGRELRSISLGSQSAHLIRREAGLIPLHDLVRKAFRCAGVLLQMI